VDLLAVEQLASGERSGKRAWTLLATLAGLQLLAGHPETAFFTALACGIYLLARGTAGPRLAVWTKVVSAWFVGLLLSGVALVPLAFTVVATDRWHEAGGGGPISLSTIFALWLRFVLPNAFGQATTALLGSVSCRRPSTPSADPAVGQSGSSRAPVARPLSSATPGSPYGRGLPTRLVSLSWRS
jgi:hypothetical protein